MAGSLTQKPRRIHHRNTETQKKADRLTPDWKSGMWEAPSGCRIRRVHGRAPLHFSPWIGTF